MARGSEWPQDILHIAQTNRKNMSCYIWNGARCNFTQQRYIYLRTKNLEVLLGEI